MVALGRWVLVLVFPVALLTFGCPGPIAPPPPTIPPECTDGIEPTFVLDREVAEIGFASGQGVTTHAEPLGVLFGVAAEDGVVARFLDDEGVVAETSRRAHQLFLAEGDDRCRRVVRVVFPSGAPEGTFRFELEVLPEGGDPVSYEVDAMCITENRDDLTGCEL